MQDEDADGDLSPAAVAQRAEDGHIRPAGAVGAFPKPGLRVAARRAHGPVEEALDDPWIPAHRLAAIAVAPPAIVLNIEDRADRDDADAEWISPSPAALREILPNHEGHSPAANKSVWTASAGFGGSMTSNGQICQRTSSSSPLGLCTMTSRACSSGSTSEVT